MRGAPDHANFARGPFQSKERRGRNRVNSKLKPSGMDASSKGVPPIPSQQTTNLKQPHLPDDGPWSDVLVARLMGRVNRILYEKKKKKR